MWFIKETGGWITRLMIVGFFCFSLSFFFFVFPFHAVIPPALSSVPAPSPSSPLPLPPPPSPLPPGHSRDVTPLPATSAPDPSSVDGPTETKCDKQVFQRNTQSVSNGTFFLFCWRSKLWEHKQEKSLSFTFSLYATLFYSQTDILLIASQMFTSSFRTKLK